MAAGQFVELLVVGVEDMPDHLFYAKLADGSGFPFSMASIPEKLEKGMKVEINFAPTELRLGLYSVKVLDEADQPIGEFALPAINYYDQPMPQII